MTDATAHAHYCTKKPPCRGMKPLPYWADPAYWERREAAAEGEMLALVRRVAGWSVAEGETARALLAKIAGRRKESGGPMYESEPIVCVSCADTGCDFCLPWSGA